MMSSECCYYLGCLHCSSHPHQTLFRRVQCTCDNLVIFQGKWGGMKLRWSISAQTHHLKIRASSSAIVQCLYNMRTGHQTFYKVGVTFWCRETTCASQLPGRAGPWSWKQHLHHTASLYFQAFMLSSLQCSCCFIPFSVSFLSTMVWSSLKVRSLTVNHSLQM